MKHITISMGFITNSSSVIHWYPKEVMEDAQVQAFIKAYDIQNGYVGSDLWNRGACGSFLTNDKLKEQALASLNENDYEHPNIPVGDDTVVLIYGDEYADLTMELSGVLSQACTRLGLKEHGGVDYN